MPVLDQMPHTNDSLTRNGRLQLAKALAPEYFANDMLRRLSVNKGSRFTPDEF